MKTAHKLWSTRALIFFLSPQTHFCPQPPILLNTLSSSNFPPLPLPPSLSLSLSLAHLSTLISCPLFNIFPFGVFTHKTQFLLSIMRFTAFLCTSICRFTKTIWTSSVQPFKILCSGQDVYQNWAIGPAARAQSTQSCLLSGAVRRAKRIITQET